jgi:hypothetical protein
VTSPSDDGPVGYKRPPKRTRWRKGRSGNPHRRYSKHRQGTVELIDRLLLQPIKFIEGGETRQVSTLEAILLQLWRKELLGDQRALKVRLQYQELAIRNSKPKLQLTFVDNDYTRAMAAEPLKGTTDDER